VEVCLKERQFMLAGWCGSNLVTLWVHQIPQEPVTPGCYVHLPSGCPKQRNAFDSRAYQQGWRPDIRGEAAAQDKNSCGDDRRHQINGWCGVVDSRITWVQQPPPQPEQLLPSGLSLGCRVFWVGHPQVLDGGALVRPGARGVLASVPDLVVSENEEGEPSYSLEAVEVEFEGHSGPQTVPIKDGVPIDARPPPLSEVWNLQPAVLRRQVQVPALFEPLAPPAARMMSPYTGQSACFSDHTRWALAKKG